MAKKTQRRTAPRTTARAARPARSTARRGQARPPKPGTVTPYLAVSNATDAIAWYKQAFGAKELSVQRIPSGQVMHAALKIGDSQLFLSDVFPGSDVSAPTNIGGTTVNLHVYGKNIQKLWQQAVQAGAKVAMPLENQFWGDTYGKLTDPFGHSWGFSYPAKMTKEEMEQKRQQAMAMMGGQ
ncbi:MAG: VOC family protein [Halobacteriales archaeon]|nr:VOC family protein [Halobacteriales archaeon]